MAKEEEVNRPLKKTEYKLVFATRQAQKGWQDLVATQRNVMVDVWEFLTKNPKDQTPTNYPLKGGLNSVVREGICHERWQHKPTISGTARIWFYVSGNTVYLERVHTTHPNETKR